MNLNRAGVLVGLVGDGLDKTLVFRYRSCQARVLDFKREFCLAAQKYYSLSRVEEIAGSERIMALSAAIICAGLLSSM
jgi:COP9 signalosome complex subunit 4